MTDHPMDQDWKDKLSELWTMQMLPIGRTSDESWHPYEAIEAFVESQIAAAEARVVNNILKKLHEQPNMTRKELIMFLTPTLISGGSSNR